MGDRMRAVMAMFHLDAHHKIERFGMTTGVLVMLLVVLTVSIAFTKAGKDAETLGSTAAYSTAFTSSLTQTKGTVENVYVDSGHTKAFVLLKLDSTASVSTDAADYRTFVTGSTLSKTQVHLASGSFTGSFYVFGSTGYMGIYLYDASGFDSRILSIVVRDTNILESPSSDGGSEAATDASFSRYDQYRLYVNPTGSDAVTSSVLDETAPTASELYAAFVGGSSESSIRDSLNSELSSMNDSQKLIAEYENRLSREGIVVPALPSVYTGDSFWQDSDGDWHADISTDYAGGYDFDWASGSVETGYLDSISGGQTYEQYTAEKKAETENTKTDSLDSLVWYKSDGSILGTSSTSTADVQASADVTSLKNELTSYLKAKQTYQVTTLKKLLDIENTISTIDQATTIHADSGSGDVVRIY